jgi:alpha-L-fucosidase
MKKQDGSLNQRLVQVTPSARQLSLQQKEFYAFVHFTVNTFTGKEWGDGTESPAIFNPTRFDADQWVAAIRSAGMKGLILTCKHHDGFCLWPSRFTGHSVAASPFRNGQGDVVREVADACRRGGIAFGVYLSPWDRNHPAYGYGDAYNDYFVQQLTELLTGYGEIFSVWFDGACGEGSNGKKQVYDWDRYYEVIRTLQPNACIHVCGPDIRWCGNEAGDTRPSEWSVVPSRTRDTERIAGDSQQADDAAFLQRKIRAWDQDLGSREVLKDEMDLIWYPAEVNTSIRPGWFYHAEEDDKVRSVAELVHIYEGSVGGNATFLLNIPPTPEGLFHRNDCACLEALGRQLREPYAHNLLETASLSVSASEPGFGIEAVRNEHDGLFFKGVEGAEETVIDIVWPNPQPVSRVVMKEQIEMSQRIERFEMLAVVDGREMPLYAGTVVGYKRIASFPTCVTTALRVRIPDARVCPTLSFLGVY